MPVRLTIHFSDRPANVRYVEESGEYLLGRDPACELVLADARVSRRHARLTVTGDRGRIADLGSKNGLAVDGRAVRETALTDDCWISVGGLLVRFESGERAAAARRADARRSESNLAGHRDLAASGLGVGELVDRLLASFLEISGTRRGFLLLARGGGRFEVVASHGLSADTVVSREFSGSASTVQEVLAGGEPLVRSDALECPDSAGRPSVVEGGIRAIACVPLLAAGRTLGAVYGDSQQPGRSFDELDVEILSALASHAALAMWAAGLKEEIAGLAGGLPTRAEGAGTGVLPLPGFPAWSLAVAEPLPGERA